MTYNPNDRVRSRDTGNLGTVTQAGQREGFVHVLFDGSTDAICFDTRSLEPDRESQVAALTAERDALKQPPDSMCWQEFVALAYQAKDPPMLIYRITSDYNRMRERIAALEKQLGEAREALREIAHASVSSGEAQLARRALAALSATPPAQRLNADEDWPALNRERGGELIHREIDYALSLDERMRLSYLTGYADAHLAVVAPRLRQRAQNERQRSHRQGSCSRH